MSKSGDHFINTAAERADNAEREVAWLREEVARLERDKAEFLDLCRTTLDSILDHNRRDHRRMCNGYVWKAMNGLRAVIGPAPPPLTREELRDLRAKTPPSATSYDDEPGQPW